MVEHMFDIEPQSEPEPLVNAPEPTGRNSKRRKLDISSSHDVDHEDTFYNPFSNASKGKGGIGYDGDITEDVCRRSYLL